MSLKIKAGTRFVLPVEFEDTNFAEIHKIEFLFKQNMSGKTLKTALWVRPVDAGEEPEETSRDAELQEGTHTILVSFSRDDSYLFRQGETFFMDTRIHYSNSDTNPYTKILGLQMSGTLFAPGEEVTE